MEENLRVDNEYKEAFNLGYELAMELNLKSPLFKDISSSSSHLRAIQAGMDQYNNEIKQESKKNISSKEVRNKDRGQGFNLSI